MTQRVLTLEDNEDRIEGLLLGTAVGDAMGLPAENLSAARLRKFWHGGWRMRLLGRWGMVSDDTEHTLLVAQSLLSHPSDPEAFQRCLAWKLRWWFASLPAGVGLATARACLKLWIGFPAGRSGVKSAGAGPAMRSAILGAFFSDDATQRRTFVAASSTLTHRSWQAEVAAQAVAECVALVVRHGAQPQARDVIDLLKSLSEEAEWREILRRIDEAGSQGLSVSEFASGLGLARGVTGYCLHVVPVAIYSWLRHPGDFRQALLGALDCGGDTDTVGAIVGALAGSSGGTAGIPREWVDGVGEWPRSVPWMRKLANRLANQRQHPGPLGSVPYFWPGLPARNALVLGVVLFHGFRRLFPPY